MEEKKVSTLFEEMRDDISNYITSSLQLGKLELFEKVSLASSATIYGVTVAGISLMAVFFILITAALYLGDLLQHPWAGFAIMAAFSILTLVIILLLKKPFKKRITNRVIRFLMAHEEKEDKKRDK